MAFYNYLGYGTYSKLHCTVPGILLDISALIHRWQAITVVFMQDGAFELLCSNVNPQIPLPSLSFHVPIENFNFRVELEIFYIITKEYYVVGKRGSEF